MGWSPGMSAFFLLWIRRDVKALGREGAGRCILEIMESMTGIIKLH